MMMDGYLWVKECPGQVGVVESKIGYLTSKRE
jgi:hypothetical protein